MTSTSMDRPSYHHGNLREALLACAERKLEVAGPQGLSLRELARELGVSHGAPRPHFADKQSLLDALVVRGLDRLGSLLDKSLNQSEGTFKDRLTIFAATYVDFAANQPAMVGLIFARKDRPDASALREANDRAFAAPMALIANAQETGEIDSDDPDRTAMAVLAMLQGLASMVTSGMLGGRSINVVVSGTIHALVEGLRPHRSIPPATPA
jgi:AcrR family transcriptional regulator